MAAALYFSPFIPTFNSNGLPSPGASLTFYYTETTTKAPIYADSDLTVELQNPVASNSAGKYPNIYLDDAITYAVMTLDKNGAQLGDTIDPYIPGVTGLTLPTISTASAFATTTIAASINVARTDGYTSSGIGGGDYVDDALSDAALAAAHPRFCFATANGRYFRLLPHDGLITVEQAGAVGEPGATFAQNDQPAINAAIRYLEAVQGYSRIGFTQRRYTVWATQRTSNPDTAGVAETMWAVDGHPIYCTKPLEMVNLSGAQYVEMNYRNYLGGSFNSQTPGTGFQVVNGFCFRGFAVYAKGNAVDPGYGKRASITAKGFHFKTDRLNNNSISYPASAATGLNWDIWHKGIGCQPDVYNGGVDVRDCWFEGWGGEGIYPTNRTDAAFICHNTTFSEINGQSINPSDGPTDVRGLYAYNCALAMEGSTGKNSYIQGVWENCGAAGGIKGGTAAQYAAQASRTADSLVPNLVLDIELRKCVNFYPGPWISGKIKTVDTAVILDSLTAVAYGITDVNLAVEAWCDNSTATPLQLIGPATLTTYVSGGSGPYKQPLRNIAIELNIYRTDAAARAPRQFTYAVEYSGYIDAQSVHIDQRHICALVTGSASGTAKGMPHFIQFHNRGLPAGANTVRGGNRTDVSGGALTISSPIHSIHNNGSATLRTVTIAAPSASDPYGFGDGQEIVIVHNGEEAATFQFDTAANLKLMAGSRKLYAGRDYIKLRWDNLALTWYEVDYRAVGGTLYGSATYDPANLADGAGATTTVTVTGAVLGDIATATFSLDLQGITLTAWVSAADTVSVRFQNESGGALDLASGTLKAKVEKI